jgi:SAM-dependent methyltransferase
VPSEPPAGSYSDHFSSVAARYALSRPRYPDSLFAWLASLTPRHRLAWDAGTGNGQAAIGLAQHFERVVATDASPAQVAEAEPHPAVSYGVAPADRSGLAAGSVDLVTVAQAAHWFELDAFYREVRRVLTAEGVVALWSYALPLVADPGLAAELAAFAERMVPWWPPGRSLVDTGYRTLPFPFEEIPTPSFAISADWTIDQLLSYIRTWSSVTRCTRATGADPVTDLAPRLVRLWGGKNLVRGVRWPISVRAGRLLPPLQRIASG